MEEEEALKRAYAEMILNTAKEAASRVMEAELKARRFEQSLIFAKEESSRMLLRSKQLIDAKNEEAEVAKSSQQRKIDELECQLNEAEDVIVDLRAELVQAREVLKEKKKIKALHSSRQIENVELRSKIEFGGYDPSMPSLDSGSERVTFDGKGLCLDSSEVSEVNYKDCGPTQLTEKRLCETETGLVNERLPLGDRSSPCNSSTNIENASAVESTSMLEENVQEGAHEAVTLFRRSTRKRKLKSWNDVMAACGNRQFKKHSKSFSHLSRCKYNKVKECISSPNEFQTKYESQTEESIDCVDNYPSTEMKLTESTKKQHGVDG